MSVTHVQVLKGTNQKLKDLKKKLQNEDGTKHVSSQDDVINHLLDYYEQNSGGKDGKKRDRVGQEQQKAKNYDTISQPLSYNKMASSEKAMVFFTGMKKDPRDWVFQELKKAELEKEEHNQEARRKSNDGHRKLPLEDRVFLYLLRIRRNIPFEGLGILFSVSHQTAINYYVEIAKLYHETLTPRLLRTFTRKEIEDNLSEETKDDLPNILYIFDGTGLELKNKENVLLQRLLYSSYHHRPEASVVLGCTLNGLFQFRTKLFGGMSAEVTTMWNGCTIGDKLKAAGITPEGGFDDNTYIALADSAYNRSTLHDVAPLMVPTPLPEDGSNPRGAELKRTHLVQSHRGLIERLICKLKKFQGLENQRLEDLPLLEILTSNAMAQTNLVEISRQGLWELILDKEGRAVSPYIISREKEKELPKVKKIKLDSGDLAPHIKRFYEDFKAMAPELKLVVKQKGEDAVFSKRVLKRGANLSNGGYILQYAFQDEGDGLWTVHAAVGASMRGDVYDCFFQIKKDMSIVQQTCSCLNGQNFCSHCVAAIDKLLEWNDRGDNMTLVQRKSKLTKPDLLLRKQPLSQVVGQIQVASDRICVHPEPIKSQQERQRCYCGKKSNNNMLNCETCWEWYHFTCLGVKGKKEARKMDFKCGFCLSNVDNEGFQTWKIEINDKRRKDKEMTLKRKETETPRAMDIKPDGMEKLPSNLSNWEDMVQLTAEKGKAINVVRKKKKDKAEKILKHGGHHVTDMMVADGVGAQPLNDDLIDKLDQDGYLDDVSSS